MSLMDMWATCDRCSFKYRRRQLRVESTGFLVCRRCDDGNYDLKAHPQNKPPRRRKELLEVPDGTPDVEIQELTWGNWCVAFGREDRQTFFLKSVTACNIPFTWDELDAAWENINTIWENLE